MGAWFLSRKGQSHSPIERPYHYLGVYGVATPGYAPGSSGRRAGVNTCQTKWVNLWSAKAIKHPKQTLTSRHSAQGLPRVSQKKRASPEGAPRRRDLRAVLSRTTQRPLQGLIPVGELTQGKPWAKLFWPLRATDWPAFASWDRR